MPNRIRRDRALPLDLLADEAVHELELRQIWQRDWVFAAPVDAVAEPGDHVAVTIGDQSVILVRGADYEIRAFANACSHRGAPLVEGSGNGARLSCPYHAWTYGTDGGLLSVPYTLPDEVDASGLGLTRYRCETWQGLAFVNLEATGPSLSDRLELIEPYVRPLGISRLHHDVDRVRHETWASNWKAIHANALDSYSHFRLHAETIEPTSPTDGAYYLAGSAQASVAGGESFDRADHVIVSLPPSFVAVVHSDSMVWQSLTPRRFDQTEVRIGYATEQPATPTGEADDEQPVHLPGWHPDHIDEDRRICEALQRNARTRTPGGPLLGLERAIGDFHDYLRWHLTGADPAPAFVAAGPGERPEPA